MTCTQSFLLRSRALAGMQGSLALGLPGVMEFVVIIIVGVLVLGILLTTWGISRSRRRRERSARREEP